MTSLLIQGSTAQKPDESEEADITICEYTEESGHSSGTSDCTIITSGEGGDGTDNVKVSWVCNIFKETYIFANT